MTLGSPKRMQPTPGAMRAVRQKRENCLGTLRMTEKDKFEKWCMAEYGRLDPICGRADLEAAYLAGAESHPESEREAWERGKLDAQNARCEWCMKGLPFNEATKRHYLPETMHNLVCHSLPIRALAYPGDAPPKEGK